MCQGRSRMQQIQKVKGVEGLNYEAINESDWNAQNALPFDNDWSGISYDDYQNYDDNCPIDDYQNDDDNCQINDDQNDDDYEDDERESSWIYVFMLFWIISTIIYWLSVNSFYHDLAVKYVSSICGRFLQTNFWTDNTALISIVDRILLTLTDRSLIYRQVIFQVILITIDFFHGSAITV